MIYKNQLEQLCRSMQDHRQRLIDELETLPEGLLYIEKRNDIFFYSQRIPKGGNKKKEHRIGITNDSKTIFDLVRKKYILSALPVLEKNIQELERTVKKINAVDEGSVMKAFIGKYPQLAEGIYQDRSRITEWQTSFEPLQGFYEDGLKSLSGSGLHTRSVGELYISSKLDDFDIPYRYEAPIGIPDLSYIPDFTIIRPRDNKLFYWEHFGMTDSEEYIYGNIGKIGDYIRYGIVPWDNLIITYSFSNGGLNAKLIDCMIDAWLL